MNKIACLIIKYLISGSLNEVKISKSVFKFEGQ